MKKSTEAYPSSVLQIMSVDDLLVILLKVTALMFFLFIFLFLLVVGVTP
ncbi:MAG: hypothetical protein ACFFDQ_07360 [Candidatus Thorarchaeota archaeon]